MTTAARDVHTGGRDVSIDDARAFVRDGHVTLRAFYDRSRLARLGHALRAAQKQRARLAGDVDNSLTRDMFLSRFSDEVAALVRSPRLAAVAAELLGARAIRFVQDVLMEKSGEQVATPWHRDSDFWSFSGVGALTIWIPLQDTAVEMSPLRYADGSHRHADPHPLGALGKAAIPLRYRVTSSAMMLGDVAIHEYRTLHGAAPNVSGLPRRSIAVHLIDADARIRAPRFPGQFEHASRCGWDRCEDGAAFTDEIAPLI
jgi:ectoine hydroxylase-related dioxygenase (phytanoyl-CoA dioxygenase family)